MADFECLVAITEQMIAKMDASQEEMKANKE
jgi:hypothetical protein